MKTITICGQKPLYGAVKAHCAKNSLLPILAVSILAESPVLLKDCPPLTDVSNMISILQYLGCQAEWQGNNIYIDPRGATRYAIPDNLARVLRSSIFMLGSIIGRFHHARVSYPGGCDIGLRPIDLHLKALARMGVEIREEAGFLHCFCKRLRGNEIYLDYPSVGATENVMLAAATAEGVTRILNAAMEPEIIDLAQFINRMGGRVEGAGTQEVTITGIARLHGVEYRPMTDRIVAGTYLIAGAITGGQVTVEGAEEKDLKALYTKLAECGCKMAAAPGQITCQGPPIACAHQIETLPFPGFPTDLQAQMMALQLVCPGTCILNENVFENRFKHVGEFRKMGADITLKDRTAIIRGGKPLQGCEVYGHDLRGSAALVLAGLAASGITTVQDAGYLNRGYYRFEEDLASLGAQISYTESI